MLAACAPIAETMVDIGTGAWGQERNSSFLDKLRCEIDVRSMAALVDLHGPVHAWSGVDVKDPLARAGRRCKEGTPGGGGSKAAGAHAMVPGGKA